MEEPPQDADYFVQLNELYVKFKLVTKKMNQSETDGDENQEKADVELTEWIQASQKLTDAILGLIATHHVLAGLKIEGRWVDVRDPEVLSDLERHQG